jgi:hypothetical protein
VALAHRIAAARRAWVASAWLAAAAVFVLFFRVSLTKSVSSDTANEANLIALDSGGRAAIGTVTWRRSGTVPRAYESEASWHDPRLSYANFVVMNSADGERGRRASLIPYRDIVALAGRPAHTYLEPQPPRRPRRPPSARTGDVP